MPSRKKIITKTKLFKLSNISRRLFFSAIFIFIIGFGLWSFLQSQMVPSDINLIATEEKVITDSTRTMVVDSAGCYYQAVQCVQEPCDPIRICPTYTATPTATKAPDPIYSATPVSTPLICARDVYLCPDGTKVGRSGPNCEFSCPKATPVASAYAEPTSIGLSSFKATNSCGTTSFTTFSYSCNNNLVELLLSNSGCTDFTRAYKTAYAACSITPTITTP